MQDPDRDTGWFVSTRSGANNGTCVEVRLTERTVSVRDSKNRHGHQQFAVAPIAWQSFLDTLR